MKKIISFACMALMASFLMAGVPYVAKAETASGSYKAFYSADWYSGSVINAENETTRLPIASMCKIMTLLLCFEEIDSGNMTLNEKIPVSENASGMGGSQVFLESGAEYVADKLIESICIASANDSCVAMAERICGSEEKFVERMNEKAEELGAENTNFVNCTGLPKPGQYSCAKDVFIMLSELLHHNEYFKYSKIWMDKMVHPGGRETEMSNTNKLIRFYNGCDAGKTGYTSEAGHCLAASATRGNMRIVSVVIGAKDSKSRFEAVKKSFDNAFANYSNKIVVDNNSVFDKKCPVSGGKADSVSYRAARSSYIFSEKNSECEITFDTELYKVKAPVRQGEKIGEIVVYKDNVQVDCVDLVANEAVAKMNYFDSLRQLAKNWNF